MLALNTNQSSNQVQMNTNCTICNAVNDRNISQKEYEDTKGE
jgi:hypothetical protein